MRESRGEITTNGVLRLAGELKRDVYLDWRDKVIDPLTEEQAAMLRGYVAWKIMNWRAMEEAERSPEAMVLSFRALEAGSPMSHAA